MKKTAAVVIAVVLAAWLAWATPRDRDVQVKSVSGQVTDNGGQPLANAIVYLKNMKTLAVKTFIAQQDGSYQFHGLSPNVDYDLYAEYKGQRSDNKTISQFDSRTSLTVYLKINPKK